MTYEASRDKIHFLELEIKIVDKQFKFQTHFKPTDRNGFIPTDSCHHRSWLNSIPRSQFLRLRRNCTETDTFLTQAGTLKQKFLDKGYNTKNIEVELQRVTNIDRGSLLVVKPKKELDKKFKWAMLTSFSIQHKQIKTIIKKHWDVLKNDKILNTTLPEQAKIIFRGAPALQNRIAPKIINPPVRSSFFHDLVGFFPCKKCVVCHNLLGRRKTVAFRYTVTNKKYTINHFSTCSTKYVVYLITCPCGKQYVGCTIRMFSTRVSEHIALIKGRDSKHTVPRHYKEFYNSDHRGSQFIAIDRYISLWRGGAMTRGVSHLETF